MAQPSQILRHLVPLRTDFSAQECHDHSKDFPRDDNISAGSVLSRISSLACARTYLLFVFVLKHSSTTISLVPKNGETCEMQQKNTTWLSHFMTVLKMESYQHEETSKSPRKLLGILLRFNSLEITKAGMEVGKEVSILLTTIYTCMQTTSCLEI